MQNAVSNILKFPWIVNLWRVSKHLSAFGRQSSSVVAFFHQWVVEGQPEWPGTIFCHLKQCGVQCELLESVNSCCKLSAASTAETSYRQFWRLKLDTFIVVTVNSFDSCYQLLSILTAITSCRQVSEVSIAQMLEVVNNVAAATKFKLLTALIAGTSCWLLKQAVDSWNRLPTAVDRLEASTSSTSWSNPNFSVTSQGNDWTLVW